jgi:hypothetical protein
MYYTPSEIFSLMKDHPDWAVRNDGGVAANCSSCGQFFYGIDATNPGVRAHVHETIRRPVQDWKFDVLKINFCMPLVCWMGISMQCVFHQTQGRPGIQPYHYH